MKFFEHIGRYVKFLGTLFGKPEKFSMYWKETFRQMNSIGIESLPIILVVSLFIGAVTAVQFAYQVQDFVVPMYYIGYIVRDTMIIEMAPTLSCMILAGKAGSNMASELGNMRISEQIDAMEIMGINTSSYLVGTKMVAAFAVTPLLVVFAAVIGISGGMIASVGGGYLTVTEFERGLRIFYNPFNIQLMLIKSFVFAFLFSSIACFQGFNVKGGTIQLAAASTKAVVYADIFILLSDYVLAQVLLIG